MWFDIKNALATIALILFDSLFYLLAYVIFRKLISKNNRR